MEGGFCVDANREAYSGCSTINKTTSECEADCSSLESCIGYTWYADTEIKYIDTWCYLYTNRYCKCIYASCDDCAKSVGCPSNYEFYEGKNFARTSSDLKKHTEPFPSASCYGKTKGKNIKPF